MRGNLAFFLLLFREIGDKKIRLCVVSNDYEASTYKVSDVDLKGFKLPVTVGSNAKTT